jgi:predicted dithiol-disulfide oxidoreductase (DUF899 family)
MEKKNLPHQDQNGHAVLDRQTWLKARQELLAKEKEFTRLRDQLNLERRQLPWVKVDKDYVFAGAEGAQTLEDLFGASSQLIVYHFMYGPDWDAGCTSCSFWADNFDGIDVHLKACDIALVATSNAPWVTLDAYKQRMGWRFNWVSSMGSDFNRDYHVSFSEEELAAGPVYYNYRMGSFPSDEAPGISVFCRKNDQIFHTYSCYARGLDMLNGAYHFIDLSPKGRQEEEEGPMHWLSRHDEYPAR